MANPSFCQSCWSYVPIKVSKSDCRRYNSCGAAVVVVRCKDRNITVVILLVDALGQRIYSESSSFKLFSIDSRRRIHVVRSYVKEDDVQVLVWPENLEYFEMDQREYTIDDKDRKVQDVILRPDPSNNDTMVLKKTLSCSYPNLPFNEALQKENEKLYALRRAPKLKARQGAALRLSHGEARRHRNTSSVSSVSHWDGNGIQIYLAIVPNLFCGGFVDDFLSHLMCCCCALVA
ncbi:hypothetical protein TEA_014387 [Camellia sinensis var. sinensis]|uniref:Uncharacterized protein n=1 Tax=Camellia sinensis var. sinensis TaxID=542762 RepID=A0A4S4F2I5_CAMSN|nr:hypothetical protein TEA_014387 [Camellia sinensis var. sinensis]